MGKQQPDFQRYIRGELKDGPGHAWFGAYFAAMHGNKALPLAVAIAAHHGALANVVADEANHAPAATALLTSLARWREQAKSIAHLLPTPVQLPSLPTGVDPKSGTKVELFTRFLFSALVDADRSCTARFYARHMPALTSDDITYDDIATLSVRLDAFVDAMPPKGSPAVIGLRRQVLSACRDAARRQSGPFSLTVPTGGGKTLSAMSFALNPAREHSLRRVIVVIPSTSIIEQSGRIYGDILNAPGRPNVLVDFPVVFRALAGLDSIAQSTGRCDREGTLTDAAGGNPAARMVVFRAETAPPPGTPRKAFDSMEVLAKLGPDMPTDLPPLAFRVRGPLACFARPEFKAERFSYPVMTPSVARGVLKAVLWKPAIRWRVERIKVLAPIAFTSFRRNEVGSVAASPVRATDTAGGPHRDYFADEDRQQRNTVALRDVDYVIEARIDITPKAGPDDNKAKFVEMFRRRVEKGQHFHQPYLGCREFAADVLPVIRNQPPPSTTAATSA